MWETHVSAQGWALEREGKNDELNSEVIEYVQGIEVLKAFKQTGKQFEKFIRILGEFRDINLHLVLKGAAPAELALIVLDLGLCLILLFTTIFLFNGSVSLTVFLIFLIMGLRIYEPIKRLIPAVAFLKLAEPAVYKIKNVLDTKPLTLPKDGQISKSFDVQFANVIFSYDKTPVLENVSFTIPEKTIAALVGPSGSGKTTITRLIARFWDVDSGEVKMGGRNIKDMKIDALLSRVSMVFQDKRQRQASEKARQYLSHKSPFPFLLCLPSNVEVHRAHECVQRA